MASEGTHPPSARTLRQLRERGLAPQSRLLTGAAVVLGAALWLSFGAPAALADLRVYSAQALGDLQVAPSAALARAAAVALAICALPLALATILGALASGLQVGGLFAPRALAPDPSRLGARGLVSGERLLSALSALVLTIILAIVTWPLVRAGLHALLGRVELAPQALAQAGWTLLCALAWRGGLVLVAVGIVDAIWQRYRFHREHRMTHAELVREQRELEGEPLARRRRARIAREGALGPSLSEAIASAVIAVRGDRATIAIAWPDHDAPPSVAYVGRDALERGLRARRIAIVHDAGLAAELARVPLGSAVPRRLSARLARHLARSAR